MLSGADTIIWGGPVVTVDPSMSEAEAVAIRDGKITAVGTRDDVIKWRSAQTEIIDLKGRTLMPGLIEPHTHPILSAALGLWVDVSAFKYSSAPEVWAALREAAARVSSGQWVLAFGWDPAMLNDLVAPTLAEMDELAPENPLLILTQTMHTAFVNTKAYEVAGVTASTPKPSGGGQLAKDSDGNLNGTVLEVSAIGLFTAHMPKLPYGFYRTLLTQQYRRYAREGYTSIAAPGPQPLAPDHLRLLQETADAPESPLRVFVYPLNDIIESVPFAPGFGSDRFRVLGVKLHIDGSPYAGGMAMNDPYLATPLTIEGLGIARGSRGSLNFEDDKLAELVEKYHRAGWQIAAHVQGERAIDQLLDIYEDVLGRRPRKDHRHRLEHNALITEAQLARAAALGVTTSFYIDHVGYYGSSLKRGIVGPERAARFMPMATALRLGHRATIHTDTPCSPLGPLRAMRVAVTREMLDGSGVLGPEETITVDDAIRAVTINAAWQLFAEDRIGSTEVGKLADFVVLSDNPRSLDPRRWEDIEILETFIDGRRTGVFAGE